MKLNRLATIALLSAAAVPAVSFGKDYTWTGAAGNAWEQAGNWSSPSPSPTYPNAPADTALLTGATQPTITLNGGVPLASLTFGTGVTTSFNLTGGSLSLAAGGTISKLPASAATTARVTSPVVLAGDVTFSNTDGADFNGRNLVFAGPISGTGTISIAGTRSGVVFSGNNSGFSGNIVVKNSGMLLPNSTTSLGGASSTVTLEAGSSVFLSGSSSTSNNWIVAGNASQGSYSGNTQSGNFQVNAGATFNIANGGGNFLGLPGVLSGPGNINFEYANTTLSGATSNTLAGTITNAANSDTLAYNTLTLAKTGGAIAVAGPLSVANRGVVKWAGNNQVASSSPVTLAGGTLAPSGFSNSLGTLNLTGRASIDLNGGASALRFADSSALNWTGSELLVKSWTTDRTVSVGTTAAGLAAGQLGKVGFVNPAGSAAGLYHATIGADGKLAPTGSAVQPANPQWDMSPAGVAERSARYGVQGMARLSGAATPLKADAKISFFGDSTTWLNGYVTNIASALAAGDGTKNLNVKTFNHGINGGGVRDILNGSASAAFNGGNNNGAQPTFAQVIAADQSDVAVVFIGVNDLRHLGTPADTFRTSLTQIVSQGKAAGTDMVLCTVFMSGERPDGGNPDDAKMEQFAQITRDVAAASGVTLVDLRRALIDYERNNNFELHLDGSLTYQTSGILTYDGIHASQLGDQLIANLIADGIATASVPEPGTASVLLLGGCGLLLKRRRLAVV